MEKISNQNARMLMLAAQGLDRQLPRPAEKLDLLDAIRRMGVLQIDTIHVVARSHYLVLWSRLGDYRPEWLDELQAEGALFEYWAHAMCFIPIEDYPLYRRKLLDGITARSGPVKWAAQWVQENPHTIERVITHLRENGAVRSAEFESSERPAGGWWNWKEEKNALEALLFTGKVMIARRQGFQRVYDLSERILPGWDDRLIPTSEEYRRELILRAVKALGIALPAWAPDYFRLPKMGIAAFLESLAADGSLLRVGIEGLDGTAYVHPGHLNLLTEVVSGNRQATSTTLLSPFDPLVWDRQRARQLFDFDYMIECYMPAAKRRYGYFSLPILQRGRLIGRLDAKAHRPRGLFEVKALHLEPGVPLDELLIDDLASALQRLANWHATPDIVVRQSDPSNLATLLNRNLDLGPD
jgi:uncharacterized protein